MRRRVLILSLTCALIQGAFAAPSTVRVRCSAKACRLQLNGKPYFVKGAVGAVHLQELSAAGGNSIRAGVDSLDAAQSLGLTVLAGLPFGKQRMGFDYNNAEAVARQREEIRRIVIAHKDHPALLAWAIGNELEINTTPEQRVALWKEVDAVARIIHQLDPRHPVITPVGDAYRHILGELDQYAPSLDAVGLNSYVDMLTLPGDLAAQGWKRPYLITEFGPRGHWQVEKTPWKLPIEDTSTEKAAFYRKAYMHAVADQPKCLGSYVFHWAQHHEKTHTWYGMFLEDGSRTEAVDVMTELWSGKLPQNRSPRIDGGISVHTDDPDTTLPVDFPPETFLQASVNASDPDGDPLQISWELRKDVSGNQNTGGDREEPTPPIPGLLRSAQGNHALFQLPAEEGPYRIFVYVRDGRGNAATANYPLLVKARHYPAIPAESGTEQFGSHIQRTMRLLATSTARHRNPVKVLFYGQSLTAQAWTEQVSAYLRRQFPYADLTVANRAIGGYSTQYLLQTVASDVYSFYPDLIIFHDFGSMDEYEKIIAGIRRNTTAEVLIQTDRPAYLASDGAADEAVINEEAHHEKNSLGALPAIAAKYGAEIVDLRGPWIEYLHENHLKAKDVLRDGAHFTLQGDYLIAGLTIRHLRYMPAAVPDAGPVRDYEVGSDVHWQDGRLRMEFEGNRIDLIAGQGGAYHAAEADVLIDGKPPSEFPGLFSITRPTDTVATGWPAVNRVMAEKPLIAEDWTLRITEVDQDEAHMKFEVRGSVTGPDGTGSSDYRFVSNSGRVIIEPTEWGIKRAFDLWHAQTPVGFEVQWSVVPMFTDRYRQPRVEDHSREYATTLALGLTNGKHTLELVSKDKTTTPNVRAVRVYRPAVQ